MQESQLLYKQIFGIHNKENVDFLKKGENLTNLITLKVFERVHVYFNHMIQIYQLKNKLQQKFTTKVVSPFQITVKPVVRYLVLSRNILSLYIHDNPGIPVPYQAIIYSYYNDKTDALIRSDYCDLL